MTEAGMLLSNLLHGERRPGSVGSPLPGVEARLAPSDSSGSSSSSGRDNPPEGSSSGSTGAPELMGCLPESQTKAAILQLRVKLLQHAVEPHMPALASCRHCVAPPLRASSSSLGLDSANLC